VIGLDPELSVHKVDGVPGVRWRGHEDKCD
jgi:hypothetical protein